MYVHAIEQSSYHAILNEKIPPISPLVDLPKSYRFNLIPEEYREDREHPDVRIARRAETLARVAAVAHERGEVSAGLRRVIGGVWVFRTVCFERVVLSSPGCLWPGRMDDHEEVLEAHA